jgi:hypothetical protein
MDPGRICQAMVLVMAESSRLQSQPQPAIKIDEPEVGGYNDKWRRINVMFGSIIVNSQKICVNHRIWVLYSRNMFNSRSVELRNAIRRWSLPEYAYIEFKFPNSEPVTGFYGYQFVIAGHCYIVNRDICIMISEQDMINILACLDLNDYATNPKAGIHEARVLILALKHNDMDFEVLEPELTIVANTVS